MPADKQPLSVAELLELPNDSWVNDGFTAVIRSLERAQSKKTGKPYWKCELGDTTGSATVKLTMFFAPKFAVGQQVDFLGQGIKFKNGQYGAEVSVGDKAEIHVVGNSVHHQEQQERKETGQTAINGQSQRYAGDAVGMSIKEAMSLAVTAIPADKRGRAAFADPLFWQDVKVYAGNLLRIGESLKNGHLSPPSWPTPQRSAGRISPDKPAPGPDGAAFDPADGGEDVAF